MTIETKLTLHCDLCLNITPILSVTDIPVGWSSLVQGNVKKHVCPFCLTLLKAAEVKSQPRYQSQLVI